MLKVLHVHDSDLDDHRIINAAVTGKKNGYEPYFCGMFLEATLEHDQSLFKGIEWVRFSDRARVASHLPGPLRLIERAWKYLPYPRQAIWTETQFGRVIDKIRPDLIHAHNIFAGYYCLKFKIPMILDDHEFYSMHFRARHENDTSFTGNLRRNFKVSQAEKYEVALAERGCPVISVSNPITKYWIDERHVKHAYTIPNYPAANYIQKIGGFRNSVDSQYVNSVYIGADSMAFPSALRNISGLYDLYEKYATGRLVRIGVTSPCNGRVRAYGLLPMQDAYRIMQEQGHVGLLPWKKHWFHHYCCPNKVYEYAHCGNWLATISDVTPIIEDFNGHCDTFDTYEQLAFLLQEYDQNRAALDKKRQNLMRHAQENFIWEKKESHILDAYKVA